MQSYTLCNNNGLEVEILSFGARMSKVLIPISEAQKIDVLLGYDHTHEYKTGDHYLGAICGRVANRIVDGKFELDGKEYQLSRNDAPNHLHGGTSGFSNQDWSLQAIDKNTCKLSLHSPDGHEGYPGKLDIELVYSLDNANCLSLQFHATTDQTTILNLTSHPYFNLKGSGEGNVLDHKLWVNATHFTPLGHNFAPTGEIRNVANSTFDLRKGKLISDIIASSEPQIRLVNGLDHNWMLPHTNQPTQLACTLSHPASGRSLQVHTSMPGIQAYLGMHFDGNSYGKNQKSFTPYCGIALEAQGIPDAPNKAQFPSIVLRPGETYQHEISYTFQF